jgi:hypothetical protein
VLQEIALDLDVGKGRAQEGPDRCLQYSVALHSAAGGGFHLAHGWTAFFEARHSAQRAIQPT